MGDNKILTRDKRRRRLSVCREAADIQELMGDLPGGMFEHKLVSFCRISSTAFLRWVADQAVIYRLSLSTFRVGPRALRLLSGLYSQGRLNSARFVVGRLASSAREESRERKYFDRLASLCGRYGWQLCGINNHSKIALFDTDGGRFVLESSSNLNEAPNWEQFTFQRDDELYDFYARVFDEMFAFAGQAGQLAIPKEIPAAGLHWPEDGGKGLWS